MGGVDSEHEVWWRVAVVGVECREVGEGLKFVAFVKGLVMEAPDVVRELGDGVVEVEVGSSTGFLDVDAVMAVLFVGCSFHQLQGVLEHPLEVQGVGGEGAGDVVDVADSGADLLCCVSVVGGDECLDVLPLAGVTCDVSVGGRADVTLRDAEGLTEEEFANLDVGVVEEVVEPVVEAVIIPVVEPIVEPVVEPVVESVIIPVVEDSHHITNHTTTKKRGKKNTHLEVLN